MKRLEESYLADRLANIMGKIERSNREASAASAKYTAIRDCLWDEKIEIEHRLAEIREEKA